MNEPFRLSDYISEETLAGLHRIRIPKKVVFLPATKQANPDLFYIISGTVACFTHDYNGRKFVVDTLGSGEFIGKFSQMRKRDFNCGVEATSDCELLVLTPIKEQLFDDPKFALAFYIKTTDRIYEMYKLSMLRMMYPYEEILAYWLLTLSDENHFLSDNGKGLCRRMNISERQYFYLLKKFQDTGLLTREKKGIRILDETGMRNIAENVLLFMQEDPQ